MEWFINNWYLIVGLLAVVLCIIFAVVKFFKMPTKQQIENLKQWLLWAVVRSEKELGEKTGVLKLRLCYDWAIEKFPWVASLISFETFDNYVKEALKIMEKALEAQDSAISKFVSK